MLEVHDCVRLGMVSKVKTEEEEQVEIVQQQRPERRSRSGLLGALEVYDCVRLGMVSTTKTGEEK